MPNDIVLFLYFLMWHFLVILSVLFTISGLDDLFIDIYYWFRFVIRIWKTRKYNPLTYEMLNEKPEQYIAVLVPCWHEANVIGTMLKHNNYSIDYKNYYIFVGVYPNDPETVAEVQNIANETHHVQCVIGKTPGPTNKAANLNGIYAYIKTFEKNLPEPFQIFLFHDSEDIIHPLSFKLYNYLIPRKDMIQIPVFPLHVNYFNFTHWLYADEFSEIHTKDIIVRESIKAHVPSAGVGTAFSKSALEFLEKLGEPFSINSLTEDYHTSLAIRMQKFKCIFVTQSIMRTQWKRRSFFRKGYKQIVTKEYVATRALFPTEYKKAIRQKARWIIGIVFQEWDNRQWSNDWIIRYSLMHDRKSFITHFINGFSYLIFTFWVIYSLLTLGNPEYPSLQEQFNNHRIIWWLIITVTLIMIERMLQRCIAVKRVYGWIPAILAIPRTFYGNFLNLHALLRAYKIYFSTPKKTSTSNQPVWDKTEHHFPGAHTLVPFRRKLGDLLLEKNIISKQQLYTAIIEQQKTGEKLGAILCRLNFLDKNKLLQILSEQYELELFSQKQLNNARELCLTMFPQKTKKWLTNNNINPIEFDNINQTVTLAIDDPTNELLLKKIIRQLSPYKVKFKLLTTE